MSAATTTTTVELGELTFDVDITGPSDAPTVVLLHGFPESRASWRPVTELLVAQGLRTVAPDQRGYSPGARPDGVDAYHIDHLVADVVGILDALDLPTAHVAGHDWGAIVAWALAAAHPDRVSSLTTASVPHPGAFGWALRSDADQQQRSAYIDLFRKEGTAERVLLRNEANALRSMFGTAVPGELVDVHVELLTQPGALTAALNWDRAMTRDMDAIAAASVPTTYVWSTEDLALGRAGAEKCAEFVSGPYRFVELDGGTHWIPEENPQALAEAVAAQVRSQP